MSYPVILPKIGNTLAEEIDDEIARAERHGKQFSSLHEAYAVILEEVDEIWDLTRLKKRGREPGKVRQELIQLAAMAIKAIHSIDNFVGGDI